jgi:hypothetical protein
MLRRVVFQPLLDGGQRRAREFCQYVCHGDVSVRPPLLRVDGGPVVARVFRRRLFSNSYAGFSAEAYSL